MVISIFNFIITIITILKLAFNVSISIVIKHVF